MVTKNQQKGYINVMKYHNNIPKSIKSVRDFRVKVLEHKNQYGISSAIDAFDVGRSTIYLWQKKYLASRKLANSLSPKSTKPKRVRKSKISFLLIEEVARIRYQYPRMGKSKLKVFLDEYCEKNNLDKISESSIGRIIKRLKNSGKIPSYKRLSYYADKDKFRNCQRSSRQKLRRAGYYPKQPGELVQVDCVIKIKNGIRRYIVSAIDYVSSFAYSYAYKSLSSTITSDFMDKLADVAPFTITHIQTDNGGEFSKHFDEKLAELNIVHFWNYAKKPIYNGKIERYNRTSQEEFIDPNIYDLFQNIDEFNAKLVDWCIYYNTKRPHFIHRDPNNKTIQIPPLKAYIYMLKLDQEKSNMLWTHTLP